MRVLGLIPARGGSKGVPRKNIRLLSGKPLLAYTTEAALAAKRLTRIILSTEDAEIAAVGQSLGVEVPFLRPIELAQDDTPTLPVVQHTLRWLEEHDSCFDAVCLLQPTCPLRRPADIDASIELLERSDADSVISVLPVPLEYNPHWVYFQDKGGWLRLSMGEDAPISRRQDLPPAFHREGSIYVSRRDIVMEQNCFYGKRPLGYPIEPQYSVNIDTEEDWARAEKLLLKRLSAS
jgi:CMP-N,N'-diacetyllegionaminic acid synthase